MSGDRDTFNFVRDLVSYLREQATQAARRAAESGSEFDAGYEFGLRQALSRIHNQAIGFDISLAEIGLHGFDPLLDPLE